MAPALTVTRSRLPSRASTTCPAAARTTAPLPSAATRILTTQRLTVTVAPKPERQGLRGDAVKVTVDYEVCASTGTCVQVCPEVFEIRADGFLYLLIEGDVPAELHKK